MEHIIRFYGRPNLVQRASVMFVSVEGASFFNGVSPDVSNLRVPKSEDHCNAYRLTLCRVAQRKNEFETCGYGSEHFLKDLLAFRDGECEMHVGGLKVYPQKKQSTPHHYELRVEILDR